MSPITRPRVEGDREEEILDATVAVLLGNGYDKLTLDAVAKKARASKATLYRRWESKAALVLDALSREKGLPGQEVPDTGSLRGDLIAVFCAHHHATEKAEQVLGAVVTALGNDAEFAAEFRTRFIEPKLEVTRAIYSRAIGRGEIDADLDLEVIAPAMAGIVLHRSFVLGLPVDDDFVARVVDNVILPAVSRTRVG